MIFILIINVYLKKTHSHDVDRFKNNSKASCILMQVYRHHKLFLYIRTRWASNSKQKLEIVFFCRIYATNRITYIYIQRSKTCLNTREIRYFQILDNYNFSKNIRKMDSKVCMYNINDILICFIVSLLINVLTISKKLKN